MSFWVLFKGMCVCTKSLQWCPTLCHAMDYNPPGFSVHGILQARILEWVAMLSSKGSSWLRDRTCISCIAGRFFTAKPLGKHHLRLYCCLVAKSCLTLCDSMACRIPLGACAWNFPGRNTGVGSHFLFQEICLTQGLNPGLLYGR